MTETLVPGTGGAVISAGTRVVDHPAWPELKAAVEEIRPWQAPNGSIDFEAEAAPTRAEAAAAVERVIEAVETLSPLLPHATAYHQALVADLRKWAEVASRCRTSSTPCWPSSRPPSAPTGASTS